VEAVGVMGHPIRCAFCGCHAAESDVCAGPGGGLDVVCADSVACIRRQLARAVSPREPETAAAAGIAQVDRAVRTYRESLRRGGPSPFVPPADLYLRAS
jgi:hypothetical protein